MSGPPGSVDNNYINFTSSNLTSGTNVPGSLYRQLTFTITNAEYVIAPIGPTVRINTSAGNGDVLFLRNVTNTGSTGTAIIVTTDASGNGSVSFNVLKGSNTDFMLYYSPSSLTYSLNDHTSGVLLRLPNRFSPGPNGVLEVTSQTIVPTSKTGATISLSGVIYDGFTATAGSTSGIIIYQQSNLANSATPPPNAYNASSGYNAGDKVVNSVQYTDSQTTINSGDGNYYFCVAPSNNPPLGPTGQTSSAWLLATTNAQGVSTLAYAGPISPIDTNTMYNAGDIVNNGTPIYPVLNTTDSNTYMCKAANTPYPPIGPPPRSIPNTDDWVNIGNVDPSQAANYTGLTSGPGSFPGGSLVSYVASTNGYNDYFITLTAVDPNNTLPSPQTSNSNYYYFGSDTSGGSSPSNLPSSPIDWTATTYSAGNFVTNTTSVSAPSSINIVDYYDYGCVDGPSYTDGSETFPGGKWIKLKNDNILSPTYLDQAYVDSIIPETGMPSASPTGIETGEYNPGTGYYTGIMVLNANTYTSLPDNQVDGEYYFLASNSAATEGPLSSNGTISSQWVKINHSSFATNSPDTIQSIQPSVTYSKGDIFANDTLINFYTPANTIDYHYYFAINSPGYSTPPISANGSPNSSFWIDVGSSDPIDKSYSEYNADATYNQYDVCKQVADGASFTRYFICINPNGVPTYNDPTTDASSSYNHGTYWLNIGTQDPSSQSQTNLWNNSTSFTTGSFCNNAYVVQIPIPGFSHPDVNTIDNYIYGVSSGTFATDGSVTLDSQIGINVVRLTGSTQNTFLQNSSDALLGSSVSSYGGIATTYNVAGRTVLNNMIVGGQGNAGSNNLNTVDNNTYEVLAGHVAHVNDYPLGPTGVTSSNWFLIPNIVGAVTGTTSGILSSILQGNTAGILTGFDLNGNVNGTINYNLQFDTGLDDLYMVYYTNLAGNTGKSYNYVSLKPFNLPLNNLPTIYNSSSIGITASFYNLNYNFDGITAGGGFSSQLLITDDQSGTTSNIDVVQDPQSGLYMAQYFFAATGGTSIVEPGSYYQYADRYAGNPNNYYGRTLRYPITKSRIVRASGSGSSYSGATASIPGHSVVPEGITGTIVNTSVPAPSSRKIVLDMNNFDYTDIDGNSIFNTLGMVSHAGNIRVQNTYSGNFASLYAGPTAVGSSNITYSGNGPYKIELADLGPTGGTTIPFQLSFYDSTLGSTRTATRTIPVTLAPISGYPEVLDATIYDKAISTSNIYVAFNNFDYSDMYGSSIFSSVTSGNIVLLDGSTSGPILASTPFVYPQSNSTTYALSCTGTFNSATIKQTYLAFQETGNTGHYSAKKSITLNPNESFRGTITNLNTTGNSIRFDLSNFDYLDSGSTSIFYSSWYTSGVEGGHTGNVVLYDSSNNPIQSLPFVSGPNATYSFNVPSGGPFTGCYLGFFDTVINFTRQAIKGVSMTLSGLTAVPSTYASGGTAYGFTGPAAIQFPYVFTAMAAAVTDIIVLGELTAPIAYDQKVVLNVPPSELQRMIAYDSAWSGGQYGIGSTAADGFSGVSGTTSQFGGSSGNTGLSFPFGFTGPNVGLFLNYVLSNVNVNYPGYGFTGHNGVSGISDRLGGLDLLFSSNIVQNYQTLANIGGTGNYWGLSADGQTGYFADDSGTTGPQIVQYMTDHNISGVGATYSSQSLLNFIPVEAIRSITQNGFSIDKISNVVQDVDTMVDKYVPALQNLFEQSVAYGRVDDSIILPLSNVPSALSGITNNPWSVASKIYGVDFVTGDSLTFYIKYLVGAARRYGIDPTVVSGLTGGWQNLPSLTLTFNGVSFDIPIGISDPASGLTGGGSTGGSDRDIEFSNSSSYYTLAVQLVASSFQSAFDY